MSKTWTLVGLWSFMISFVTLILPTFRLSRRSHRLFPELGRFADPDQAHIALNNAFNEMTTARLAANLGIGLPGLALSWWFSKLFAPGPLIPVCCMAICGALTGATITRVLTPEIRAHLLKQLNTPPLALCPHCDHELPAYESNTCPECGHSVNQDSQET